MYEHVSLTCSNGLRFPECLSLPPKKRHLCLLIQLWVTHAGGGGNSDKKRTRWGFFSIDWELVIEFAGMYWENYWIICCVTWGDLVSFGIDVTHRIRRLNVTKQGCTKIDLAERLRELLSSLLYVELLYCVECKLLLGQVKRYIHIRQWRLTSESPPHQSWIFYYVLTVPAVGKKQKHLSSQSPSDHKNFNMLVRVDCQIVINVWCCCRSSFFFNLFCLFLWRHHWQIPAEDSGRNQLKLTMKGQRWNVTTATYIYLKL